ncbi:MULTISPECIES: hypothetical protein [unclassified Lysobacter]|uniref:hypothetical protein n=1 Tax=unclassified Lysobacter TaxID=2635362 RepID=UPI001BE53781|nr:MULTISPECIES: hypothetical protein [unclassified Lysobacter]MBT2746775.1 hypothetical protein [Lysobacter sp. ISL-42]MBT2751824.1 hypothetical protein [Lysobacter sp. ISL-50]MBT2778176.1 hypothetical protein [Lysobacter sp. ISL-54]MBT2781817.1 hypothetical protein [Lysobacter sp. ISL-52]
MKSANVLAIALLTALVGCKATEAPAGDATKTTQATVASPTAAAPASTPTATEPAPAPAPAAAAAPAGDGRSLCAAGESVVFSCTLSGDKKFASLCASKGVSDQAGYVYFAQGAAGHADFVYPADKSAPAGRFKRSHLGFGGGSGGFAYSFEDAGRKHIVYSISGEGLEDQGVIVAAAQDLAKAESALACEKGSVIEDEDDALFKYTMSWPKDEAIEKNGLPPKN